MSFINILRFLVLCHEWKHLLQAAKLLVSLCVQGIFDLISGEMPKRECIYPFCQLSGYIEDHQLKSVSAIFMQVKVMLGEASRLGVLRIRMETNSPWNPVGVYKVTNVTLQLS